MFGVIFFLTSDFLSSILLQGDLEISAISGRLEPDFPVWKRNLFRYFVTMPIILLCLVITFAAMLSIFELQEWINDQIDKEIFSRLVMIASG